MTSKRIWHNSGLSSSVLYVEETKQIYSDGMPATESTLLATICKEGHWYDVRYYQPAPHIVRGFLSLHAAKTAAEKYISTHDHAPKRQLP